MLSDLVASVSTILLFQSSRGFHKASPLMKLEGVALKCTSTKNQFCLGPWRMIGSSVQRL